MQIAFSKKDINSTAWFSLEKGIHLFTGVFIVPKIFNTLGTVDIGKLHLVEAVLGLCTPLFFLELASICIREMVLKPKNVEKLIVTVFFMRFFTVRDGCPRSSWKLSPQTIRVKGPLQEQTKRAIYIYIYIRDTPNVV